MHGAASTHRPGKYHVAPIEKLDNPSLYKSQT